MVSSSPMAAKYTDVKGHATYYHYSGATTLPEVVPDFSRGKRIVMVHGAGSNAHTFHRQVAALGERHSPIAPDLPGHGRSASVEGLRSIGEYSDFVAAFMDALKIDSAVILGHSMGGAIAMDLAIRRPDRVEALILSSTAAKFNVTAERLEALRAVTMGRTPQAFNTDGYSPKTLQENFDAVREGWMEQIKTDPRVRYTDMVAVAQADLREAIAKIAQPALVLAGADDKGTTVADAELIAGKISGAKLHIVAGAGHFAPRERPAEYNAAIEEFLNSLAG